MTNKNNKNKNKSIKIKSYKTLHDGDEPFTVEIGKKISVYNNIFENEKYFKGTPVFINKSYKKIFNGRTSFLIDLGNKYMYIGKCIYEFEPEDITLYRSPTKNSFVPYPYAKGKTYTYLMIENVYILNELLDFKQDIYLQYYDNKEIGTKYKIKCVKSNSTWKC
jgi:hypothetical protein